MRRLLLSARQHHPGGHPTAAFGPLSRQSTLFSADFRWAETAIVRQRRSATRYPSRRPWLTTERSGRRFVVGPLVARRPRWQIAMLVRRTASAAFAQSAWPNRAPARLVRRGSFRVRLCAWSPEWRTTPARP